MMNKETDKKISDRGNCFEESTQDYELEDSREGGRVRMDNHKGSLRDNI